MTVAGKVHHVFNSSLVSGPETLVLPNLSGSSVDTEIVLLQETRIPAGSKTVADYARSFGFTVHEIPVKKRFDLDAIRALKAFWAKHRPALIHTHGPKAALHAMLARKMLSGKRPVHVTTHHGVRANDQSWKLMFFEKVYERFVIPSCEMCLTVCSSDRELLINRGINEAKIQVHLNGVDRTKTAYNDVLAARQKVRAGWQTAGGQVSLQDTFVVGVVGRLAPEKQHDLILNAVAQLIEKRPESKVALLCFGSGPLEAELKKMTQELKLWKHVFWMGYSPNIAAQMPGFDLLLSMSSAEGLPINLIEAGWAGIPVLAQAVDGVRDLIEDGVSGKLLSPPASGGEVVAGLEELMDQPEKAGLLAKNFQVRVEKYFSRSAWLNRLTEIYSECGQ